jgi:predicted metal-dependent hydrolase
VQKALAALIRINPHCLTRRGAADRIADMTNARFLPGEAFPAYAYTPGRNPHPVRDPRGHSFGAHPATPAAPVPERWRESHDYLRGCDLFNAGYYWEAHESWEGLWNACGREGPTARLLQGLIALAAAGVKLRQGTTGGARAHARRAMELLASVAPDMQRHMGLDLAALSEAARVLAESEMAARPEPAVLDLMLRPQD